MRMGLTPGGSWHRHTEPRRIGAGVHCVKPYLLAFFSSRFLVLLAVGVANECSEGSAFRIQSSRVPVATMLHAAALSDMASGLIPQDARYRQVRSGLHYEPVGSLLQLRGGYSGEHLELSFERQMTRMQALKDKMLAAIKRGDKAAARDLSRELKALKATAERRFRKLQGAGTPALEPASDAPGVAGNSSRDGADGLAVERGRTRVRMVSGSTNTTTAGEAVGAHPEAWTTGMLATYLELLRRMDAEGKRQRAELDAEMRAQVEAAGAREEAVCMDASGRLEADALAHGLAKCRNQSCAFCCEEHHDAELDLSLRHDGIQASLDPPLVFHFVKRGGRGAEGAEGERGGEQGSEDLLVVLPSSHLPLAPSPSKCRPNGTQGLLVRLNHSVFMTVEDRETLALVAQGKEVAQTDVAALEARLPALNAEDEQRRKGRVEWEEHVAEEYRLQQAEDMVWDGEARSLNEGLHLLALREHARDRWYSIRGPHDDRLHMGMGHIACYTRRGEEEVERRGLELQLCHASWQGNLHEVRRLLQAGARVRYHMCFYRRWTPLHFAAAGGWPEVVDELVQAGAEVNATDDGQQHALFAAAAAGGQHLTPIPDHIAAHLPRATPWPTPNNKGHTTQVPTRRGNWSTEGSLAVARRLVAYDIHLWARDHAGMTADQVLAPSRLVLHLTFLVRGVAYGCSLVSAYACSLMRALLFRCCCGREAAPSGESSALARTTLPPLHHDCMHAHAHGRPLGGCHLRSRGNTRHAATADGQGQA